MVAAIPPGKVMTYGQIATALGRPRASRVVGSAMRLAPAERNLPCHRVVNARGELAPTDVFGSKLLQRELLRSEGVIFLGENTINMKECLIVLSNS